MSALPTPTAIRQAGPDTLEIEWKEAPHRRTASTAFRDAAEEVARTQGRAAVAACAACHDPIWLIAGRAGEMGDVTTPEGRREGLSCLLCHSLRVPATTDGAERRNRR